MASSTGCPFFLGFLVLVLAAAGAVEGGWLFLSDSFLVFTAGVGGRSCSDECSSMCGEDSCLECVFWGGRAGLARKGVFFAGMMLRLVESLSLACIVAFFFSQYLTMPYFYFSIFLLL